MTQTEFDKTIEDQKAKAKQQKAERMRELKWVLQADVEDIALKAEESGWRAEEFEMAMKTKVAQFLEKIATRGIYTQEKV